MKQVSAAGPFGQWPLGRGFDRWYGFQGAFTDQWNPELYRDKTEVERWKERDPIRAFVERMTHEGLLPADALADLDDEIALELDAAIAFAEAGTLEPVDDLTRFVTSERAAP